MEAWVDVLERAIVRGPIPGAAAAVGGRDEERVACFGRTTAGGPEVSAETWYDLASLTKVLCTVPLCLEAIGLGLLDPQAPLREVLPEVGWMQPSPGLADATILQLATHTSGLPAWQPLYTLGLDRATLLAKLEQTPLDQPPGTLLYSDLGFMLLGTILERLHHEPLNVLAEQLYARLGFQTDLSFTPPAAASVAPTEHCPWRARDLCGEVHDQNAAALGGVSGHAGLFGTLTGVTGYARAMLDGRLHSRPLLDYLSHEHVAAAPPAQERRGFGWLLMTPGWSGGDLMSRRSIGHTGFTGTGLWIDFEREQYSVLLTNRVHPSRYTPSNIPGLRRAFGHAAHAG